MDLTHLPLSGPPSTTASELQQYWLRRHRYALTIAGYYSSQQLVAPSGVGRLSCHGIFQIRGKEIEVLRVRQKGRSYFTREAETDKRQNKRPDVPKG